MADNYWTLYINEHDKLVDQIRVAQEEISALTDSMDDIENTDEEIIKAKEELNTLHGKDKRIKATEVITLIEKKQKPKQDLLDEKTLYIRLAQALIKEANQLFPDDKIDVAAVDKEIEAKKKPHNSKVQLMTDAFARTRLMLGHGIEANPEDLNAPPNVIELPKGQAHPTVDVYSSKGNHYIKQGENFVLSDDKGNRYIHVQQEIALLKDVHTLGYKGKTIEKLVDGLEKKLSTPKDDAKPKETTFDTTLTSELAKLSARLESDTTNFEGLNTKYREDAARKLQDTDGKKTAVERVAELGKGKESDALAINETKMLIDLRTELKAAAEKCVEALGAESADKDKKLQKVAEDLTTALARINLISARDDKYVPQDPEKTTTINEKEFYVSQEGNVYEQIKTTLKNKKTDTDYMLCDAKGNRYNHKQQIQLLAQDATKLAGYGAYPWLQTVVYTLAAIALVLVIAVGVAAAFHTGGMSLPLAALAWTQLTPLVAAITAGTSIGVYTGWFLAIATVGLPAAAILAGLGYKFTGRKASAGPAAEVEKFIELAEAQEKRKVQDKAGAEVDESLLNEELALLEKLVNVDKLDKTISSDTLADKSTEDFSDNESDAGSENGEENISEKNVLEPSEPTANKPKGVSKEITTQLIRELTINAREFQSTAANKNQKGVDDLVAALQRVKLIMAYSDIVNDDQLTPVGDQEDKNNTTKYYMANGNYYGREVTQEDGKVELGKPFLCDNDLKRYDHNAQLKALAQDALKLDGHREFPVLRTIGYTLAALALTLVIVAGVSLGLQTGGVGFLVAAVAWTQLTPLVAAYAALPGIGAYTAGFMATATFAVPLGAGVAAYAHYGTSKGKKATGVAGKIEAFIEDVEKNDMSKDSGASFKAELAKLRSASGSPAETAEKNKLRSDSLTEEPLVSISDTYAGSAATIDEAMAEQNPQRTRVSGGTGETVLMNTSESQGSDNKSSPTSKVSSDLREKAEKTIQHLAWDLINTSEKAYETLLENPNKKSQQAVRDMTAALERVNFILENEAHLNRKGILVEKDAESFTIEKKTETYIRSNGFVYRVDSDDTDKKEKTYILCDEKGNPYDHAQQIKALARDAHKLNGHSEWPVLKAVAATVAAIALFFVVIACLALVAHTGGVSLLPAALAWAQLTPLVSAIVSGSTFSAYTAGFLAVFTYGIPAAGIAGIAGYTAYKADSGKAATGPSGAAEQFIAGVEKIRKEREAEVAKTTAAVGKETIDDYSQTTGKFTKTPKAPWFGGMKRAGKGGQGERQSVSFDLPSEGKEQESIQHRKFSDVTEESFADFEEVSLKGGVLPTDLSTPVEQHQQQDNKVSSDTQAPVVDPQRVDTKTAEKRRSMFDRFRGAGNAVIADNKAANSSSEKADVSSTTQTGKTSDNKGATTLGSILGGAYTLFKKKDTNKEGNAPEPKGSTGPTPNPSGDDEEV